jgi:hypothetical protein
LLFYNEVVVQQSVNGSFFMVCGWNTGYFGIQELRGPDDKIVIFSVWDPTKGDNANAVAPERRVEESYKAEDVQIKRFGGEGTGSQCLWKCDWRIGETNRLMVGAKVEGEKTAYTAWFWKNGTWKKLATFRTQTGGRPLSGYHSFIEDFRRDSKSAGEVRRAGFGNGWVKTVKGEWMPLAKARFTASGAEWESKENINAGVADGTFFLATGGDTKQTRELGSLLDLSIGPGHPPRVIEDALF